MSKDKKTKVSAGKLLIDSRFSVLPFKIEREDYAKLMAGEKVELPADLVKKNQAYFKE